MGLTTDVRVELSDARAVADSLSRGRVDQSGLGAALRAVVDQIEKLAEAVEALGGK